MLKLAKEIRSPLFAGGGSLSGLSDEGKNSVLKKSHELANIFQRSSSCVEGRNGVLSFRHHELKGIQPRKLNVLTAIHNYFIKRRDGTTAAERFFGNKPSDMFKAILNLVDIPIRPRLRGDAVC
ncbi:MAG: hypothetical protein HQK50_19670 [Oligoflexia bacterium]|nr:hypothetical protein [Oligoflexia bacterium]